MTGKRRPRGEGSVHRRTDGRWVGIVDLGYGKGNGSRNRRYIYGRTKNECLDKLHIAQRRVRDVGAMPPVRLTVGEWLTTWTEQVLPGSVRESTAANYAVLVRHYIVPVLGNRSLTKLAPADVRAFLGELARTDSRHGRPLSARTVQYVHAVLRRALTQAMREELVTRNVAALVSAPRVLHREVNYLEPEQAQDLLAAARDDRLYALYAVALALGLRRGEALALRWRDIDLEKRTLRVRGSLQRVNGRLQITEPKTARSRRLIPLPDICVDALVEHRERQASDREHATIWIESDLVFTTSIGTPIEPRNLVRHFQTLCRRAGLPQIRFHDLRHTCASLLLAQGVEPRVIMETLGHSVIGTTLNIYTHVLPATQRSAADRMDDLLGRKRDET